MEAGSGPSARRALPATTGTPRDERSDFIVNGGKRSSREQRATEDHERMKMITGPNYEFGPPSWCLPSRDWQEGTQ